jgi:hypothetical protein
LLYCVIVNIVNTRDLSARIFRLRNTDFIDRGFLSFFAQMVFLTLVSVTAFVFLPLDSTKLRADAVESFQADNKPDNTTYVIRVYTESMRNPSAPLVLIAPPLTGSAGIVDDVCSNLARRGSLAVTFSRKKFDLPAYKSDGSLFMPSIHEIARNWNVFTRGLAYRNENHIAVEMENARRADIVFVARRLRERWPARPFVVIGYGVGGAAAAELAGDDAFLRDCPRFRGALAVESVLYAAYPSEPFTPRPVDESFLPLKITGHIENWLFNLLPVKINEPDVVPRPRRPVRFVISPDSAAGKYAARYAAVYKAARESEAFVSIMSLPRTCALDWTDVPRKYPVLRFLAGGFSPRAWEAGECAANAAAIFQRFVDELSRAPPPPDDEAAASAAADAATPPPPASAPRPPVNARPPASAPPADTLAEDAAAESQ